MYTIGKGVPECPVVVSLSEFFLISWMWLVFLIFPGSFSGIFSDGVRIYPLCVDFYLGNILYYYDLLLVINSERVAAKKNYRKVMQ